MGTFYARVIEDRLYEVDAESAGEVRSMFDARSLDDKSSLIELHDTLLTIEQDDEGGTLIHYTDSTYTPPAIGQAIMTKRYHIEYVNGKNESEVTECLAESVTFIDNVATFYTRDGILVFPLARVVMIFSEDVD